MLDTNLIKVENIKALISKVKDWVINLYPITYTEAGGESDLIFYTTEAKANDFLHLNTSSGLTDINLNGNNVTVKDNTIKADLETQLLVGTLDKSNINVNNDRRTKVVGSTYAEIEDGSGNEIIKCDTASGSVLFKALNKIKLKIGSGAGYAERSEIRVGEGCFSLGDQQGSGQPHGRLFLGITPEEISVDVPYGVYLGHNTPLGHILEKDNTGSTNSGTSWSGWDTGQGYFYRATPSAGTWVANYTIICTSATDGMRLAGKWFLNGEPLDASTCIQSSGGTGQMAIQGSAPFIVNRGTSGELLLKGYQNSGAKKDISVYVRIVRVA